MSTPPMNLPANLEKARITSLPSNAYYIPNFISLEEEKALLEKIASAPKPRWKQLSKRRLQIWPSDLSKKNTLIDEPLPSWLIDPVIPRLLSLHMNAESQKNVFSGSPHKAPNHVLINEYIPGQGIMPHKDGPAYSPVVCTISLGGSLCLELYGCKEDGGKIAMGRILQEERSLLITSGECYTDAMHGIEETEIDEDLRSETVSNWSLLGSPTSFESGRYARQTRTSLTYRDVLKVSTLGSKLGLFSKR